MTMKTLAAVAALLLVGGCSSLRCGTAGPYMDAETVEPPTMPEGVAPLSHQRRVTIPEAADVVHPELRGQQYLAADGQLHCLESPPPLVED